MVSRGWMLVHPAQMRSPLLARVVLPLLATLALSASAPAAWADIPPNKPGCKCSAPGGSTGGAWPALLGVAAGALVLGLRKRRV